MRISDWISDVCSSDLAKQVAGDIAPNLSEGMTISVGSDDSEFINRAIEKVWVTLAEAAVLVVLVIFLFLGSWRATLIPAVTVPICMLASFVVLWLPGYFSNLSRTTGVKGKSGSVRVDSGGRRNLKKK